MISPDIIEEVKRLADPVVLIGTRVKLWKSGIAYAGSCPFHEERQASFRVYPKDKHFVCYGCGASGDIFQFFQRADGKAFPTVVRELAASLGIVIPPDRSPTVQERRERDEHVALLAACEAATTHWQRNLWGSAGGKAREYLAERRVTDEAVRAFRLGFALPDWHDLERALGSAKIAHAVQHAAGVIASREVSAKGLRYHDRFRDRVVLPIEDIQGRAIGFGARALGSDSEAKYLNGPETPLFKKSRVLFGLRQARDVIRNSGRVLLVEGYFDVIALHQAGFTYAVAACGTTLSREQVELLVGVGCKELVLLFDGDEAGAIAAARAARVLLQANLTATVARVPISSHGQSDPDVLVARSGRRGMEEVLDATKPLTEFLIDDAIQRHADGFGVQAPVEHKLAVLRTVMPFVLAAPEGLPRATFERAVARRLGIDIGPLRQELQRAARAERPGSHP
ncbi:DNA primase [Anaeromyxobacter sp. PSR-1]|uniref:DNA primase n=1 Tax=Anaeromyxobacter sp. PSR-1 TaxID=1300915 RepID=UPI0005E28627|nr:DNA primase [Anaeromyxobacter sp. PSR-1]GAO01287.1 DNA primase [Anaeromyxobacter sp. PSR-1]